MLLVLNAAPVVPDAVFHNGAIWTGDTTTPEVRAVAVLRGVILAVGTDAEILPLAGAATKRLDLKGRRVLPGFYDSHVHFLGGGQSLSRVDLKDAKDEAEFGRRLAEFDSKMPRDRWLVGGNWDHDRAFNGKLPTAATVDKYVKNRPVFIQRYDGHMALANTAALNMAGVSQSTANPSGGVVERLADGKTPSGILKDNAMDLVDKLIPEPAEDEIAEGVRAAMQACAAHGITSVQDMDGSADATRAKLFRVLQNLDRRGELTVRIDLRWPIAFHKQLANLGVEQNFGSGFVRVGGVKGFMDGSLGSSTAKMYADYDGLPGNTGVYVTPPVLMESLVRSADKANLNVCVHAIGDQANGVLLDIFAKVANGRTDRRFRIEHVQHLRPSDYPRFKALGVVASMQPYHVVDDGRWAEGRIGKARCASSYAYRSLLDAGAVLAFGSDWPVAPLDVLAGIDAAVHRRTLGNLHPNGWYPEQRITVTEAVRAYTAGSAYAGGQERDRGTLSVGKVADMVVLPSDIFAAKEVNALAAKPIAMTVVAGRVVYEAK